MITITIVSIYNISLSGRQNKIQIIFNNVSTDYTAATFGQESAKPHSVVTVQVSDAARRAVHAALDISMFIRTRKPTGQIFYLGSLPK